jgi:hypothetical protein
MANAWIARQPPNGFCSSDVIENVKNKGGVSRGEIKLQVKYRKSQSH